MRELEELLAIVGKLEAIRSRSAAGMLADLSDWLYTDAIQMRGLIESAQQYATEILEYNAEMVKREGQLVLDAELNKVVGI